MSNDLDFAQHRVEVHPGYRRRRAKTVAIAIVLHAVVILGLVQTAQRPVRVGDTALSQPGIGAFVIPTPRPTGTSGRAQPAPPPKPSTAQATLQAAQPTPQPAPAGETAGSGQPASSIGTAVDRPVRLGPGDRLGLIKKVDPVYPPTLHAAGVSGIVVLDAIIHRDGTIGDVTILKSSNTGFEQAAIEAVRQWRYTPLPYEGIVTVTIRFMP
jgi:protein TonB